MLLVPPVLSKCLLSETFTDLIFFWGELYNEKSSLFKAAMREEVWELLPKLRDTC